MKKMLCALAIVLSACGGGGGSGSTSAQTAIAVQPIQIGDFGNSVAAGLMPGSIEGPPTPPAATAQTELRKSYPEVSVTSYGVGGTTAAQLLAGTDGSGLTWPARIKATGVQLASVNHGINENAEPIEDYRVTLAALVQTAGVPVVLVTPTPLIPGGSISSLFSIPDHDIKVEVMRQVSRAMGVHLCDVNQAIRDAGMDNLASFPDGVHATPATYAFIGKVEAGCYLPLITS